MIDTQEEISLAEFKAWLAGLIRGKRGALPDLEDWKAIKDTLDKVIPDTVEPLGGTWTPPIIVKEIIRESPPVPYINPQPMWIQPNTWPNIGDVWCGAGDDLQGGAGYFPQGQAVCGGVSGAAAGTSGDVNGGVNGCSTITISTPPTTIKERGDTFTAVNGYVTVDPEQMQFSFTADDSDGQLNDAMSMMFTEQAKS